MDYIGTRKLSTPTWSFLSLAAPPARATSLHLKDAGGGTTAVVERVGETISLL